MNPICAKFFCGTVILYNINYGPLAPIYKNAKVHKIITKQITAKKIQKKNKNQTNLANLPLLLDRPGPLPHQPSPPSNPPPNSPTGHPPEPNPLRPTPPAYAPYRWG